MKNLNAGNNNQTIPAASGALSGIKKKIFFKYLIIAGTYYLLFIIFYLIGLGFYWSNIFSAILSLIFLNCLTIFKTHKDSSVISKLLLFLFVFTLVVGSVSNRSAAANDTTIGYQSETLSFLGGENHLTKITFPKGKEFRITIYGNPVVFVHASKKDKLTQDYGTYTYLSTDQGPLSFFGTGGTATLTIEW